MEIKKDALVNKSVIESAFWKQSEMTLMVKSNKSLSQDPEFTQDTVPASDTANIDSRKLNELMIPPKYFKLAQPPFRFGVEFKNLEKLDAGLRVYSDEFYYLGSFWTIYIQKIIVDGVAKLGCYLQRNIYQPNDTESDVDRFVDKRTEARSWFKIFCFVVQSNKKQLEEMENIESMSNSSCFILESKPDSFSISQSWGWRSAKLYREAFSEGGVIADSLRCCICMGQV